MSLSLHARAVCSEVLAALNKRKEQGGEGGRQKAEREEGRNGGRQKGKEERKQEIVEEGWFLEAIILQRAAFLHILILWELTQQAQTTEPSFGGASAFGPASKRSLKP